MTRPSLRSSPSGTKTPPPPALKSALLAACNVRNGRRRGRTAELQRLAPCPGVGLYDAEFDEAGHRRDEVVGHLGGA
ncbi:MAG TPA: hypothetical protein VFN21_07265 [Acidimicrobiales bacterium]|nr:hypothetical protein [Acidimicrobiales bacterium]